LARVMSGWRTCGSSAGSASNTISERDSHQLDEQLRHPPRLAVGLIYRAKVRAISTVVT
jgi:hypothetical protein